MAPPSPTQLAWRGRIEAVLRLAAPALDLLLAAGDRLSRAVDRDEPDAALPSRPGRPPLAVPPRRRVGAGGSGSAGSVPAADER
ncbi:MAG TPA: hypothetical protein VHF51_17635 [Solirubrobacteraceae bacterium]|nr:hypothetical protein [Solirubrobacteraceae bacterium]